MKVLKIVDGTWENASRDKRELGVVRELGAEVEVVAKGAVTGQVDQVDGFRVLRCSTRPVKWMPVTLNRVLSMFTWAAFCRKRNADVISGHDYIALLIGWMSNVGKQHKAKLVYDSHEFELGRNAKRSKFQWWCIYHIEHFLIKRSAFSIMVNDVIADDVQKIHRMKERPVVVRNIPGYWELDQKKIDAIRKSFCRELRVPDDAFLLMYHGHVTSNRGVELLIEVLQYLPDMYAVILGNGKSKYMNSIHELCKARNVADRILFHPEVPLEELGNYVGAANVGIILPDSSIPSYVRSLPNKFFENIQSMTPIIIKDFPCMAPIVDEYQIGLKVSSDDMEELVAAIQRMRTDTAFYAACKENLKRAKEDLCWEKEKAVLVQAYSQIL